MQILSQNTPLTTNEANDIFGRITSFDGDVSLYALFRAIAIVHNESLPLEEVALKAKIYRNNIYDASEVEYVMTCENAPLAILMSGILNDIHPNIEGWTSYDGEPLYLNRYLSQTAKTKVYTNEEQRRIVVVVDKNATHVWAQSFMSVLWCLMPWYYPEKSEEVLSFFKTFAVGNKKTKEEDVKRVLLDYVKKAADRIDFRRMRLRRMLKGVGDLVRSGQIATYKQRVSEAEASIERYMSQLQQYYKTLTENSNLLAALESQEPGSDDEVISFFESHKNLSVVTVDSVGIRYAVDDTLEFYDEDEAKRLFDNKNSWIRYNCYEEYINRLRELFIEKRGIIRVGAVFQLASMSLVQPLRNYSVENNSMPNPHVYFYGCSGGNDAYYSQYAKSGEWELAIEQSIAAAKNWSVGDSTVGDRMFRWIREHSNTPFIYVSDGSPVDQVTPDMRLVSFKEFVQIVAEAKSRESENTTKESEEVNNG
jgi:hypothetical protein